MTVHPFPAAEVAAHRPGKPAGVGTAGLCTFDSLVTKTAESAATPGH